jgi:serine/threonine protein kinase
MFAVKVLSKKKMSEEDKVHLKTEIEILKLLDHPNIVRLIEVFEEDQYFCLVMELLEGGELLEQIVNTGNLSETKAKEATTAIISAI